MVARPAEGERLAPAETEAQTTHLGQATAELDCESLCVDISTVSNGTPRWDHADKRRFRVKHALRSLEDALTLLHTNPADGIEVAALERVRDDLAILLRLAEAECR